jgi:dihydroorotase (multifunctional complex type)
LDQSFNIINGKIWTQGTIFEGGVHILDGKMEKIGKASKLPKVESLDAKGNLILPGLIDLHVHFREPGDTHKEDFLTGTKAAAAGGVTTVVDEPNNKPVISTPERLRDKLRLIKNKAYVDYSISAALTLKNNDLIREFREYGTHVFAIFDELGGLSTGLNDSGILYETLNKIQSSNSLAYLNCRESEIVVHTMKKMVNEGKLSPESYNLHFPHVAEYCGAARRILLSHAAGVKTHLREISTQETVCIFRKLRNYMTRITTEVRPDHLFLNIENTRNLGPYSQQWTPLRSKEDSDALWYAIKEGLIDVIASDHATHTLEEKDQGWSNIWRSPPGLPSIETMLPLLLTKVNSGELELGRLIQMTSTNPAKILGVYPQKGTIERGSDADLVVVDLKREAEISGEAFFSKNKWTPFEGWQVKGLPVTTFVRGVKTFDEGEILGKPGQGRPLGIK